MIIPPAVETELRRSHSALPVFLNVVEPKQSPLLTRLRGELDAGEAEAICVARELDADRLLIDEKAGRAIAIREGLAIVGLVGVLVAAKQKGLLTSVRPLLDRLETEAGFRLAAAVKNAAIQAAGEFSS